MTDSVFTIPVSYGGTSAVFAGWRSVPKRACGSFLVFAVRRRLRAVQFFKTERLKSGFDTPSYFRKHRNIPAQSKKSVDEVTRYADMFSAMGAEARLRIMQLLLSAHPEGLVVGEIQEELSIPNSPRLRTIWTS